MWHLIHSCQKLSVSKATCHVTWRVAVLRNTSQSPDGCTVLCSSLNSGYYLFVIQLTGQNSTGRTALNNSQDPKILLVYHLFAQQHLSNILRFSWLKISLMVLHICSTCERYVSEVTLNPSCNNKTLYLLNTGTEEQR